MNAQLFLVSFLIFIGCVEGFIMRPMHSLSTLTASVQKRDSIKRSMTFNSDTRTATSEKHFDGAHVSIPSRENAIPKKLLATVGLMGILGVFGFQQSASASLLDVAYGGATDTSGGLIQSFLLIFISEIGDKTFFIAGLLAAKYGRLLSFIGSMGALGVMTIISTVLGQIFHAIPSSLTQGVPFDDVVAVLAFTYFGASTLFEAYQLEEGDSSGIEEEKAEAEEIVQDLDEKKKRSSAVAILVQIFSLVFAAEIGDRSFLSTIALSAAQNPVSVATGAIAAHASATGIAVIGGALMSKYLSEKVIGYVGGSLFIVFAVTTALGLF